MGVGVSSGIFNFFSRMDGEGPIYIYREDCEAGWDRETGKRVRSHRNKITTCGIVSTLTDRRVVQDSGADRAKGSLKIKVPVPIYTTDERDNASADIVLARGKYWKVMEVSEFCSYWEAKLELLPDNECKGLGLKDAVS